MTERESRAVSPAQLKVSLEQSMGYLGDAIVRARAIQGCDFDLRRLPVHRIAALVGARRKVSAFFDDAVAGRGVRAAARAAKASGCCSAPGAFVYAHGYDKGSYCSCWFSIWAESLARAAEISALPGSDRGRISGCATKPSPSTGSSPMPRASCATRPSRSWAIPPARRGVSVAGSARCGSSSPPTWTRRNAC